MNKEEKCDFLIELGWTYDKETGIVYTHKNNHKWNQLAIKYNNKKKNINITIGKTIFIWYYQHGIIPTSFIKHKDNNSNNYKLENLYEVKRKESYYIPRGERAKETETRKTKNYLAAIDLTYEIIISQAKGDLTKKLEVMFYKLVVELSKKFWYIHDEDQQDAIQEVYYHLLKSWRGFDPNKYESAFPYLTEVAKRAFARVYTEMQKKGVKTPTYKEKVDFVRIESFLDKRMKND